MLRAIYQQCVYGHMRTVTTDGKYMYLPYLYDLDAEPMVVKFGVRDYNKQVFSFTPDGSSQTLYYDIEKLYGMFKARPNDYQAMEQSIHMRNAMEVIHQHGIEIDYVIKLMQNQKWLKKPGILMWWPGGEATLIDGNHRFVARWLRRLETMWLWNPTFKQCTPALLLVPPKKIRYLTPRQGVE